MMFNHAATRVTKFHTWNFSNSDHSHGKSDIATCSFFRLHQHSPQHVTTCGSFLLAAVFKPKVGGTLLNFASSAGRTDTAGATNNQLVSHVVQEQNVLYTLRLVIFLHIPAFVYLLYIRSFGMIWFISPCIIYKPSFLDDVFSPSVLSKSKHCFYKSILTS